MTHKYAVNQTVELRSAPRLSNRPSGNCRIVALLPKERGPFQYRVQASSEGIERVVDEADLRLTPKQSDYSCEEIVSVLSVAVKRR